MVLLNFASPVVCSDSSRSHGRGRASLNYAACSNNVASSDRIAYTNNTASSNSNSGIPTGFEEKVRITKRQLENILHPLLHENVSNKGILRTVYEQGKAMKPGRLADLDWWWGKGCGILNGFIDRWAGKETADAIMSGSYQKNIDAIDVILSKAEASIRQRNPNWNPKKDCEGECIGSCSKLGPYSRRIVQTMYEFFENIRTYEQERKNAFFQKNDVDRIFQFLANTIERMSILTLVLKMNSQQSSGASSTLDDKKLSPYHRVIKFLSKIPTKCHNIAEARKNNAEEIDKTLSFLPLKQKRMIYDFMNRMESHAKRPSFGHRDGDSGIHLLLAGPSGTGKTYLARRLLKLLGFPEVYITMDQLKEGNVNSRGNLEDLVDDPKLSDFENMILGQGDNGGLILGVPIDEADEDRKYTASELKEWFDPQRKIYLPTLNLTIPGFAYYIFTTNNTKLILDNAALVSRILQINIPLMAPETKNRILLDFFIKRLAERPFQELRGVYNSTKCKQIVHTVVSHDNSMNIRTLISNVDNILSFLASKHRVANGEKHLIPKEDRSKPESLDEFLARILGTNRPIKLKLKSAKADVAPGYLALLKTILSYWPIIG